MSPGDRSCTVTCGALGTNISIEVDDRRLLPGVEALVASYEPAGTARGRWLRYRLLSQPTARLLRDGIEVERVESWFESLGFLERDLCHQLVTHCAARWVLHGAALCRGDRALVLAGPSGAGKSTLSLALTVDGAGFIADDCVAITAHGTVCGIPRPIRLDPGVALPALPPGFSASTDPPAERAPAYHTLIHPPASQLVREAPLATVFAVRYAPAERPTCVRISAGEALKALWTHTLLPTAEALELARGLVSRHPCYELISGDLAQARESIDAVL